MPAIDTGFLIVSVVFGLLMGFGLGRSPEDRTPAIVITALSLAIGAVAWAMGTPGTAPEVAGAALTIGCAATLTSLLVTGRRTA